MVLASDDYSAPNGLIYKWYRSTSSTFDTIADVEAGTLAGTTTSSGSPLTCYYGGLTADTLYYLNVIVIDGANNKTVYTKTSQRTLTPDVTPPIPGNGGIFSTTSIGQYSVSIQIPKNEI